MRAVVPSLNFRNVIETRIFGICAWIGRKLDMPSNKVRLFFIYATFLTLGSPVLIYLVLTFLLNLRYMIKGRRNPVWDI